MTKPELVIVGAGGHARVCAEVATAAGFRVAAFCDAVGAESSAINGIKGVPASAIADIAAQFDPAQYALFVAIGDNDTRMKLIAEAENSGYALPSLLHPSAVISPSAEIGPGTVAAANCVVNANAVVGKGCILNTACSLDHDNVLEDGVQICPGVRSAGDVRYGERAFVGTGAILVPGVRIGREAHIAAGALVIGNVGEGEKIGRFPSRPARP